MIAREIETARAGAARASRDARQHLPQQATRRAASSTICSAHGVRGVVVISSLVDERHFEAAVQRGMVMVSYDRRATPGVASAIDHVSVDNFEAAQLAAQHLIATGHQPHRVRHRLGPDDEPQREDARLLRGGRRGRHCAAHARVIDGSTDSEYGDSEMADVGRLLAARIAALRERPTGVVAVNDMLAFGLLAGLSRRRACGAARRVGGRHGRPVPVVADQPGPDDGEPAGAGDGAHDGRTPDRAAGRPQDRAAASSCSSRRWCSASRWPRHRAATKKRARRRTRAEGVLTHGAERAAPTTTATARWPRCAQWPTCTCTTSERRGPPTRSPTAAQDCDIVVSDRSTPRHRPRCLQRPAEAGRLRALRGRHPQHRRRRPRARSACW